MMRWRREKRRIRVREVFSVIWGVCRDRGYLSESFLIGA